MAPPATVHRQAGERLLPGSPGEGPSRPARGRPLAAAAAACLAVLGLWSTHVIRSAGSVVFLLAVGAVTVAVATAATRSRQPGEGWAWAQRAAVFVLLALVPALFDARTYDGFNVAKFTAVVVGALTLAWLWLMDWARRPHAGHWRDGLHWPVLALLAWTGVSTATGLSVRRSLIGAYGSYDGLVASVAFVVVFFAIIGVFTTERVKAALAVLYLGGGGLTVLYGMLQFHDRRWAGARWDWVNWGQSVTFSKTKAIWSTFGNPNHLGGFLAVMLPAGVALFMFHRGWRWRLLVAAIGAGLVVELLSTSARGAWLAALAALAVFALVHAPEVRRRPALALGGVGMLVAIVVAATFAVGSPGVTASRVGSAFNLGTGTGAQRVEFWGAALRMANDRPLLGAGPEGYAVLFPRYQSAKLVRANGPNVGVNGPHNVFMNHLASGGYPALAAYLALVVLALLRAVGTWRRLRIIESDEATGNHPLARESRIMLAGVAGGLVAYLVQASFDVQQIALSFCFWALLGLLCVLARDAGVPNTLRLRTLVAAGDRPVDPLGARRGHDVPTGRLRGPARRKASMTIAITATSGACLLALAATVARPYRADLSYRASLIDNTTAQALGKDDPLRSQQLASRSREEIARAVALNPWEPSYHELLGQASFRSSGKLANGSPQQLAALGEAQREYARAVELAPLDANLLESYAGVLLAIHQFDTGGPEGSPSRDAAIAALRRAVRANPYEKRLADELRSAVGS